MSVTPKTIQVQDLPRVNEISFVLAKNGFGHVLNRVGLTNPLPPGSESNETGPFARRLRQALVELGPTFVKLGQVLSVRPDILPRDVLSEFQSLQDRVPPMSEADVRHVLERELGRPMHEVFAEFDLEPLGSASIAQVHRAVLLDGRHVAVKLQRRGIERRIRSDMHILYSLAQLVEGRVAVPGLHTPTAVVREFDQAITAELDFLTELRSAERLGRHVDDLPGVKVPEVYGRWSTGRLLIMELIQGRRLTDEMAQTDERGRRKLAHAIMEATYRQVFEYGFFHGDPHPGNLLVTPEGTLAYIDFGVVGTLTGAMQDTLIQAFTSMVFRDAETLALTVYRAGATSGRVDLRAFQTELEKKMAQYYGASLDDLANPTTFMEVIEMCTRFRISLPPEFAVLSRAITLVEGEIRELLPGVDIVDEVKPYAQRLMSRRFSPDRVAQDAARLMVQAQGHFRDLPTQLNQVLMDLEGGTISIVTRDPDAAELRAEIRLAVLRLSLAALASVTTLGSLLFLAAWSPQPLGVPIFGVLGLFTLGGGLGLFGALGIHVFFARFLDFALWRRRALAVLRFFSWRRDR